jgi:hypothetical protein
MRKSGEKLIGQLGDLEVRVDGKSIRLDEDFDDHISCDLELSVAEAKKLIRLLESAVNQVE